MAMANLTKIQGFDLIQETYKFVGDHPIRADILIPQTAYEGKRPTIARFHGGGLVMGDSLYMDWFPYWLSDLALEHEAVIVSANYRLMPQATGLEIIDDLADFWTWMQSPTLEDVLASHSTATEIDLARLLVTGESAGGLLSVESVLQLLNGGFSSSSPPSPYEHGHDHGNGDGNGISPRAAIAMYPTVDMKSPDFTEPRTIPPFGMHFEESIIDDFLSAAPDGPLSSTDGSYLPLMLAAIEYGHLGDWYARGLNSTHSVDPSILYPIEQLKRGVKIPDGGITIIQGLNDTVVPAGHSVPFVERLRRVTRGQEGHDNIQFVRREGEHGFDGGLRLGEEEWLRDVLGSVVEAWLE